MKERHPPYFDSLVHSQRLVKHAQATAEMDVRLVVSCYLVLFNAWIASIIRMLGSAEDESVKQW